MKMLRKNLKRLSALAFSAVLMQTASLGADAAKPVSVAVENRLAPDLAGLARLLQSGVDQKVVLTYIATSPPRRTPTAEELVRLHELGLSTEGMVALLNATPNASAVQAVVNVQQTTDSRSPQPLQNVQSVQRSSAPASSPDLVAASLPVTPPVISTQPAVVSTQPTVVYAQPAPQTVYVQSPPVVTYVRPEPAISLGIGLGVLGLAHHFAWHHGGGHFGHHGRGHYGRHR
jgi:hypothetical protein